MKKIYEMFRIRGLLALLQRSYFILAVIITLAAIGSAQAQSKSVSGKVIDDTGSSLPGVNVLEKGTSNGTVTDAEGVFRLSVASSESILVFSFVGMVSQQVPVGNQSDINVSLLSDASTLSEVVVIGYGTQEKKDVTGSVASVKSEDFNRGIISSPEQLLQGKVAGVNITSASGEPGAVQSIMIRGAGSVRSGSTPLFVVDGMLLDNSSTAGGGVNPLNFLNPQDIESVNVLKDASASAIYGARAANGVVIITTKKGKAGSSTISYDANFGISKMARAIDVFTADEFRQNVPAVGGTLDDGGASTDWQKEISRTALTQNHNISFGGGADKLTYYASLGLQDQEGIIKNNDMKRYTGRMNVNQKFLNDRLNVEMNLNATNTVNQRPPLESIIGGALAYNPTYPAYDANGEVAVSNAANPSPLVDLKLNKDITTINRVIGNISPSFEIIKGLTYKLNFGIDNSNSTRDIQQLPSLQPTRLGRIESIYKQNSNQLIENYITYNFTIASDHKLSVLAGHSFQKFYVRERGFSINNFAISDVEPINNPSLGSSLTLADNQNRPTAFTIRNELQSFFARASYDLKGKYLATATFRADGSTKFGANNKYGYFPSFSLGWRISEEAFMQSLPFSSLKLRAGWGQSGNQDIPEKKTQPSFTLSTNAPATYPLSSTGAYPAGLVFDRLANPNLQWEVSTQTDIGLDFGLLDGALSGTVDYFNKQTSDVLLRLAATADPVQVAPETWSNIKDMTITNQGLEIALDYRSKPSSAFGYNIGGNVTFIKNKVEKSPYTVISSGNATGGGLTGATINGYVNGEPIGTFYLKEFIGFDANGKSLFTDLNNDGLFNDTDRIAAGSALPNLLYNFYGSVKFKGFDLTANFNGVSGNKIYDNTANTLFYKIRLRTNQNTIAEAMQYPEESNTNSADVSTRYLKDGSFLRLNNLTLGYNFNTSALKVNNWVRAIRLSVTGQNLFVATKYDGYDPEVNTDRTVANASSYGIDYQSYPKAKSVVFGLNVTF